MKVRNILIAGLTLYAVGLTSYDVYAYAKTTETILQVDQTKITREQVETRILKDNWKDKISQIADETLLNQEGKKLHYDHPSNDELTAEAKNVKDTEHRPVDLQNGKDLEYIKDRILVKKLSRKYTLNDTVLTNYLTSIQGDLGESTAQAGLFEGPHEVMEKVTQDLENKVPALEVEKKYNLVQKPISLGMDNEYKIDLHELREGDVQHVHSGDKHQALVIHHIQKVVYDKLNDSNKEKVTQYYLNKEYYHEKINVINYLRSQYAVDLMQEQYDA
jgi:hypothetical protein